MKNLYSVSDKEVCIFNLYTSTTSALDVGYCPQFNAVQNISLKKLPKNMYKSSIKKNVLLLLGVEDYSLSLEENFVIYLGHHATNNAKKADFILPIPTFVEKSSHFSNFLGLYQKTTLYRRIPFDMRFDWEVLNTIRLLYITKTINNKDLFTGFLPFFSAERFKL